MTPMNAAMYTVARLGMQNAVNNSGAESTQAVSVEIAVIVAAVVCVAIIVGAAWIVKKMVDWAYRKD